LDKSAKNSKSEWELVIKKDLKWLAHNHPEIEIEIIDWLENFEKDTITDKLIESTNLHRFYYSNIIRIPGRSKSLIDTGNKKVASILGMDKPILVEKGNKCFFYFVDINLLTQEDTASLSNNVEFFYWSSNPDIVYKQAYKLYQWFKNNPMHRHLIAALSERPHPELLTPADWTNLTTQYFNIAKPIIYPDFDNTRFQADKPIGITDSLKRGDPIWSPAGDLYSWLEDFLPLTNLKEAMLHHWKSYINSVDSTYLSPLSSNQLRQVNSKWHYLGDF